MEPVSNLMEVQPRPDAPADFDCVDLSWAGRWPSEEVWKARLVDADAQSAAK
jgi:hypothetical protein